MEQAERRKQRENIGRQFGRRFAAVFVEKGDQLQDGGAEAGGHIVGRIAVAGGERHCDRIDGAQMVGGDIVDFSVSRAGADSAST